MSVSHGAGPSCSPTPILPAAAGRYHLGEELARGGMGVVYRARDLTFGREVAVKILRSEFAPTTATAQRFLAEAQITGQLQHPGIPPVHDVGMLDGQPFLAMKLIKGDTLDGLLKEQGAGSSRWLGVFEAVCQAVAYAHEHKVIHRDLKPSNIMVGSFGEVQVMDWGLAKILDGREYSAAASADAEMTTAPTQIQSPRDSDGSFTQAGSVLGTPAYMAPEQARGREATPASDLFSLGVVLYRMVTGMSPFQRETASASLAAVLEVQPPRPNQLRPEIPAALSELTMRLLAKDPGARPASAAEVVAALSIESSDPGTAPLALPAPPPLPQRTPRGKLPLVLGLSGGVAGALVVLFLVIGPSTTVEDRGSPPPSKEPAKERVAREEPWTPIPDGKSGLVWSREDGVFLRGAAFTPDGLALYTLEDPNMLVTRDPASGKELHREPLGSSKLAGLQLSRSGDYLLAHTFEKEERNWLKIFHRTKAVWQELDWTVPEHLISAYFVGDGDDFCTVHSRAVKGTPYCRVNFWKVDGVKVTADDSNNNPNLAERAVATPDRTRLILGFSSNRLVIWNIEQNVEFKRTDIAFDNSKTATDVLAVAPDGERFAVASSRGSNYNVALYSLKPMNKLTELKGHWDHVTALVFFRGGKRLLTAAEDQSIRLWEVASGEELCNFEHYPEPKLRARYPMHVAFSPDERFVVSTSFHKVCLWRLPPR